MSSFSENFERNEKTDVLFDTNAFYPFLASCIALGSVIVLFLIIKSFFTKFKYSDENEYRNCQCSQCKKKLSHLIKIFTIKHKHIIYYPILIVLIISFVICYHKISTTKQNIKSFNPFEILEVEPDANATTIKKAYKKLALKYHPDKNLNNLQAKAKFILITKAYDALTDEESKKNFELYGNPDGPGSMRISVGLPSFILDKKYHMKILLLFLFSIIVVIPYYFFKWYKQTKLFDSYGNLMATGKMFVTVTSPQSSLKMIPLYIGLSAEFSLDRIISPNEINAINEKFNEAMNFLPQIRYDKLSPGNRKAIIIATAIAKRELHSLKFKHINSYVKDMARLIDCLFLSQYEKYSLYSFMMSTGEEVKLNLPPITKEFLIDILRYQQCFFQGIPLDIADKDSSSYLQLPHITKSMIDNVFEKDKLLFRDFLKLVDEKKREILSNKCGIKDENKITDIIETSKSIPIYEFKVKAFVEGFCDFVCGDLATYRISIKRNNIGHKKIGIGHSMIYEGILNECVQILVINGDKIIHQHKMKINSKVSTYDFKLKMTTEGVIPIKFEIKSTCYSGIDGSVESNVKVVKVSEQRNEMLKSIEKRKVKLELSYFQQMLIDAGVMPEVDEDEEEEEEENNEKKEEKNEENKNKDDKKDENSKKND